MAPDVSVVIPTHERAGELGRALDGLARQHDPPSHEVIVVPNHGDDPGPVADAVGRRPVQPRVLIPEKPGVSAARNLGWREARSPVIVFIGDDIIPGASFLREHLDWHRAHPEPEVAVLGHISWARDLRVTPFMRWLEMGLQFGFDRIEGVEAGPGHLYTANVSLKRELLERVGGFDEDFRWGYEDLELSYRLSRHGLRLLYNRRADAEHLHAVTIESYRERMRMIGAGERKLVEKHPEMQPIIYERMKLAIETPSRGRAARFVRVVPPWVPIAGPIVWGSAEQRYLKALAPAFIEGWERAGTGGADAPPMAEAGTAAS